MSNIYTTRTGEMVDSAVHAWYGRTRGVVERVFAANPGLAALGPILPMGTRITMPEIPREMARRKRVRLWD